MSQKPPTDKGSTTETKDDALGFETKRDKQADAGAHKPQGAAMDGQHKQSSV